MNIIINNKEKEKIEKLFEIKETNISLADMLMELFSYVDALPKSNDNIEYLSNILDFLQIDRDNLENIEIIDKSIKNCIKKLDIQEFKNNEYFKNIKVQFAKLNNFKLTYEKYFPYQSFSYDDISVDEDDYYRESYKVGYFDHEVSYLVLKQNNDIWMSITPNEINTMEPYIKEAKGNVLVLGLGLGYYQYMISNKKEVKSITIIEKDQNIIKLFQEKILPQFKNKEKISIINIDAFDYFKDLKCNYDYSFIDLWHDPNDGLPLYIKFKNIETKFPNMKFSYWLEKSILAMFRRCLLTLIEEQLNGSTENDYLKAKNDYDIIINNLYFRTKNITVTSYEDVHKLCSDTSLKNLI